MGCQCPLDKIKCEEQLKFIQFAPRYAKHERTEDCTSYEEHSTNESIFVQAFLIANSPATTDDETFNTS